MHSFCDLGNCNSFDISGNLLPFCHVGLAAELMLSTAFVPDEGAPDELQTDSDIEVTFLLEIQRSVIFLFAYLIKCADIWQLLMQPRGQRRKIKLGSPTKTHMPTSRIYIFRETLRLLIAHR